MVPAGTHHFKITNSVFKLFHKGLRAICEQHAMIWD